MAEDRLVQRKLDELRAQSGRCGVELFAAVLGINCITWSISWLVIEGVPIDSVVRVLVVGCAMYAVCLGIQLGAVQPSLHQTRAFYVVMNALLMLRVLSHPNMPNFLLFQGVRTIFRAMTGLILLDSRISSVVNFLWALVHCHHIANRRGGFDIRVVVVELGTWLFLQVLLWLAEFLADSYIRLNLDILFTRNVQQAVRRLLAVLCDAEVHLTPGLAIRDPSHKVAHLLVPDQGIAGAAAIEGRAFSDFVAESDQGRFREFLSRNVGAASAEALPAASIQVHLEDSTGCRFPVDLFHANLPDLEGTHQPDHLIGIRESGSADTGAAVSTAPRVAPPPVAVQPLVATAVQQPEGPQGIGGSAAPPGVGQLDWGIFRQERNIGRHGDAASQASHQSSSVQTQVREVDFPELQKAEICFNAMSADLDVRDVRFFFKPRADAGPPRGVPKLGDWVHPSMRTELVAWVRDRVNAVPDDAEPRRFGPLLMQWPLCGSKQQELLIRVSKVALDLATPSDRSSQGGPAHERRAASRGGPLAGHGGRLAVLRLRGFKQIQFKEPQRSHRSRRRERRDPGPSAGSLRDIGREPGGAEADDASSRVSSCPSEPAPLQFSKVDLPELQQVEIRFDAAAEGLRVADVRFSFRKKGAGEVPKLGQWVQECMKEQFLKWVQDNVNVLCNDGEPVQLGSLTMRWPAQGAPARQEVLLKASKVALDFEDSDEENLQEGPDHARQEGGSVGNPVRDEDSCPAVLSLRSFQQLFVHHSTRHRLLRASSAHSVHSHRSVGRDVRKLPLISEPSEQEEQEEVVEEEAEAEGEAEAEVEEDRRERGLRRRATQDRGETHSDS